MPVYTIRLGAGWFAGTREIKILFTHPGHGTVVLRDVVVINIGSAAMSGSLYSTTVTDPEYFFDSWSALEPGDVHHQELRQVVMPGESLIATAQGSVSTVLLTGYHLGAS